MKKALVYFRKMTIRKQYLYLTLCAFTVMLLLSSMIFFQTRRAIVKNSTEYANLLSASLSSEISAIAEQANSICDQIRFDPCSLSFLQADQWSDIDGAMLKELTRLKSTIQEVNSYVADLAYVNNLFAWSSLYTEEQLREMVLLSDDSMKYSCIGIHTGGFFRHTQAPYLVFKSPVYIEAKHMGYIFVSIHLSRLSFSAMEKMNTDACFLLTDQFQNTHAFNCEQTLANEIAQSVFRHQQNSVNSEISGHSMEIKAGNYVADYQTIEKTECHIVSAVNTDHVTSGLKTILLLVCSTVIVSILLLSFVYFVIYYNYVLPIRLFNDVILDIQERQIRTLKEPLNLPGCQEMQTMGQSFSSMLISINDLNRRIVQTSNDLYEMELQKKIAELSYLRSQINPHFIYNTLELIRDIASEHQVPIIGKLAVSMGKILRYSIKGDGVVPLWQELEMTTAYLNIQQARFHNRIHVITNFPPETLQLPVIKMLLQPLVENAIFHGLEPKAETGILVINSSLEQNILKITIRDNGVGIPSDKLSEIRASLNAPLFDTTKHIGLVNTNARIQLEYGKEYGIQVDSSLDDGTCITLTLPITQERQENYESVSGTSG